MLLLAMLSCANISTVVAWLDWGQPGKQDSCWHWGWRGARYCLRLSCQVSRSRDCSSGILRGVSSWRNGRLPSGCKDILLSSSVIVHRRYWQISRLDSALAAVSCKALGRWLPFLLQLPHLQTENEKTCPTTAENDYKDQMQLYWYKVLSSHYVLGTLQGPVVSKERAFKDQVDGVTGCGEFPTMSWNPHPMSRCLSKSRAGELGGILQGFHWGTSTELLFSGPVLCLHASKLRIHFGDIIHLAYNLSWIRGISSSPDS